MVPRLVPEILSLDAFCDTAGAAVVVVVGIGDSRSWIHLKIRNTNGIAVQNCFETLMEGRSRPVRHVSIEHITTTTKNPAFF